jgi:hypothetical protein
MGIVISNLITFAQNSVCQNLTNVPVANHYTDTQPAPP